MDNSGSADSRAIRYRPDIDGLRAIAVISVVCFHLSRSRLPGGFLGVDMFFVLSGFLISAIIWSEISDGRFSIARFYDRRIRRILPALILVLFACTAVSLLLLLPTDLVGYGRSLLATLLFSANIYFWRDTNYFSQAAEQKPLLHIWSLGVEEQFYVLFPLVLVVLGRWWPKGAVRALVGLTFGSLAANVGATFVGASVPAFFLLPTRAWELGAGAILALRPTTLPPVAATWISFIGAVSLGVAMFFPLDTYGYVPVALPAVVGTALLILAGGRDRPFINRLLAWPPLVFVGLISYSLYLWHWPIIVFGQYYLVRALSLPETMAATGLMAVLATLTWHFVERPFRRREMQIARVRIAAGVAAVCLAAAGTALIATAGFPGRLNAAASVINQAVDTNYRCPIANYVPFGRGHACVMNLPSRNPTDADVILLGNSHAQMYEPVWAAILSDRGKTGLLVPASGCLPTVQANITRECIDVAAHNLVDIENLPRARTIVVGLNWWHGIDELVDPSGRTVDNTDDRALATALDDLIDRLRHDDRHVVLIGPIAEPGWNIASILSRELAFGRDGHRPTSLPSAEFEQRFGDLIRHFENRSDIEFARPDRIQCPANLCYYVLEGRALFSDGNHIASAELPRFRGVFEAALMSNP